MGRLIRSSDNQILIKNLRVASSFGERLVGLLKSTELSESEALLITKCNSIHTFFMGFPIDCVFLDGEMKVKEVLSDIQPWRITWPIWGADSVVEMRAGLAESLKIKKGEQLHVGH